MGHWEGVGKELLQYLSLKGKRGRGKGKEKTFTLYPLPFTLYPLPFTLYPFPQTKFRVQNA
ncbi:hypothetical protein H6H03_27295 [Nostoc paludosum FACHB-159]|uniref:Uncharacterized protein n=1 Tax=Nostoc paludosum FACHB-159 TaxID=2692908 RepID=A0ABR8KFE4_9NOSO|nr:hypothetical protein [Nostoc paludosum FACHB-159]